MKISSWRNRPRSVAMRLSCFRSVHGSSTLPRNEGNGDNIEHSTVKIVVNKQQAADYTTTTRLMCRPMNVAVLAPACDSRGQYIANALSDATPSCASAWWSSWAAIMKEVDALIIFHHRMQATAHHRVCFQISTACCLAMQLA